MFYFFTFFSDHEEEKDIKVKEAITHVVKCDVNKENLTDPLVVPPGDCLISAWLLKCISKDKEDYVQNLRKFLKFLKPRGRLILFGVLNGTYYTIGKEKFHLFTYDENLIQEVLTGEGFRVNQCEVLQSKVKSDITDYKGILFLMAHKEQQV